MLSENRRAATTETKFHFPHEDYLYNSRQAVFIFAVQSALPGQGVRDAEKRYPELCAV